MKTNNASPLLPSDTHVMEFRGQYEAFSNFFERDIEFGGLTYGSAEAAFQAQKTMEPEERKKISRMSPSQAKRYGGPQGPISLRSDWEKVKDALMRQIVAAKFRQHRDLQELLLSTDHAYLTEGNTWHDNEWGDCFCPRHAETTGKNKLGHILMDLRELFRRKELQLPISDGRMLVASLDNDEEYPNISVSLCTASGIQELASYVECITVSGLVRTIAYSGEHEDPAAIINYDSPYFILHDTNDEDE